MLGDADLLAALRAAHIKTIVMAERGSPMRRSKDVVGRVAPIDAWREPERFTQALIRLGRRYESRLVLYFQQDSELVAISRNRAALQRHFDFLLPPGQMVEDLVDKSRFLALADSAGLQVPRSVVLRPIGGRLPGRLGYPILVKPAFRDGRWDSVASDGKAVLAGSASELRRLWDAARALDLSLLAQEVIVGPESAVVSYHAYVSREHQVLGEFTGAKIRTRPAAFGHTTALEITDDAQVRAAGQRVRHQLQLVGVMKVDFKRDPDGKLFLLEVNPRFNLWHHPGAVAGVNLPAIAYADLTGGALPSRPLARPGVRWCRRADLHAARDAGMSLLAWIRWAFTCEAKSGIALTDPLPTFLLAGEKMRQALAIRSGR